MPFVPVITPNVLVSKAMLSMFDAEKPAALTPMSRISPSMTPSSSASTVRMLSDPLAVIEALAYPSEAAWPPSTPVKLKPRVSRTV